MIDKDKLIKYLKDRIRHHKNASYAYVKAGDIPSSSIHPVKERTYELMYDKVNSGKFDSDPHQ